MSSNRFREKALSLTKENVFNIQTNEDAFPLVNFSGVLTRPADTQVLNTFTNNVKQSATTNLGSILASGGQVDIPIPAKTVQIVDKITLLLGITNSTGAATTLCNAIQLIDNIQLWARNQQVCLSQIDGDYLYCMTSLYKSTAWSLRSSLMNTTAQWGNGAAIANGTTVQYFIPLEGSLFNQAKLNIEQIDGDFTLRIQFRPFSVTNAAAGTAPSLNEASVIINQINLDNLDAMRKRQVYQNNNVSLRYLDSMPQKFPGQALQPSQTYEYTLSALKGMVSHIFFFVRSSGVTGNNLKSFQAINTFDILDSSGVSIINYPQPGAFNLSHEYPEIFPDSSFSLYNNVYCYSFALSPLDGYSNGFQTGYYVFTGNERLRINTPSTLVAGNFDVVAYPVLYQQCKINSNTISSTRS